jgi:hypothetical protein
MLPAAMLGLLASYWAMADNHVSMYLDNYPCSLAIFVVFL